MKVKLVHSLIKHKIVHRLLTSKIVLVTMHSLFIKSNEKANRLTTKKLREKKMKKNMRMTMVNTRRFLKQNEKMKKMIYNETTIRTLIAIFLV